MTTPLDSFSRTLKDFETAVRNNLDSKHLDLMERWIKSWTIYIKREKTFKPHLNRKYNPGDIITVCYGYTVGSEQGGNRPSIVVEDNDHSDKTIMVVPLSSLDEGETADNVHEKNVFLGELVEYNKITGKKEGTLSVALTHQMRTVSKQRIIKPTKDTDTITILGTPNLLKIYKKIAELYTTKFPLTPEPSEVEEKLPAQI